MSTFLQDVRYGLRMLGRSPGFTSVVILVLALGIGANSAIFSLVNAMLLRPLPYEESNRLMFLTEWSQQVQNMSFSFANYFDVRDQNKVFVHTGAFRGQNLVLTGTGEPERLQGRQVTWGFFPTVRVRPVLGRVFTAEEDRPSAERVAVLSENFWARRFARDRSVINRVLTLNNEPYTVIGVLSSNFHGTFRQVDVWVSMGRHEDTMGGAKNRGNHPGVYVVGRLKPGVTLEQARADVVGIAQRLAEQYPDTSARQSMTVRPLLEAVVGPVKPAVLVLLGAVVFVLLIACSNVANLLLARGAARQREIAVRAALGAGRWRLVRQLLTESVLLSFAGGGAGLLVAYAGMKGLIAISPPNTPRMDEVALDATVLAFTAGISVLTGLLFGLVPALQVSRTETAETLKEGGRGRSASVARHRARNILVVSEVSLALILLVGAGLMLRSFRNVVLADPGFNSEGVLTMSVPLPQAKYEDPAKVRNFITQLLENVKGQTGVQTVATALPLLGGWQSSFSVYGKPEPPPGQQPSADITRISPAYFQVMQIRLLKGRTFDDRDTNTAPPVCIVDETFASTHWPGEDPLGKQVRFGRPGANRSGRPPEPLMTVVGVVAHVKHYGVDQDSRVELYLPYQQSSIGSFSLLVRTSGEPAAVTSAARQAVRSLDSDVPIFSIRTLDEIVEGLTATKRLSAMLLGVFAALALVLAAVGIYGVMSYSVTERTHEIGIRMALGARPRDVFRLVVGQGMWMAGIGLVLGLAGAFGLTRLIGSALAAILFRVSATDPPTYSVVPLLLAVVALLASYIPARRATRVDPMVALRYE